jgi:hypothetical protein
VAGTLHIAEPVVTEEVLRARHAGQDEVVVADEAVVTPTGWDYVRSNRIRLRRAASAAQPASAVGAPGLMAADGIAEVLPPDVESGVLGRGRCDHPDRAYGCKTEEFGSGFVEPGACGDCAVHKAMQAGASGCSCSGCNRESLSGDDVESLVQRLTDEIMRRLGEG